MDDVMDIVNSGNQMLSNEVSVKEIEETALEQLRVIERHIIKRWNGGEIKANQPHMECSLWCLNISTLLALKKLRNNDKNGFCIIRMSATGVVDKWDVEPDELNKQERKPVPKMWETIVIECSHMNAKRKKKIKQCINNIEGAQLIDNVKQVIEQHFPDVIVLSSHVSDCVLHLKVSDDEHMCKVCSSNTCSNTKFCKTCVDNHLCAACHSKLTECPYCRTPYHCKSDEEEYYEKLMREAYASSW